MHEEHGQQRPQKLLITHEVGNRLESLLYVLIKCFTPPRATTLGGKASTTPKGSGIMSQVDKLDYQEDKVDALLTLKPDGKTDGPPVWTGVDNADPTGATAVAVESSADGKTAIVRLPVDVGSFDYTITAKADVDDPTTPDVESVSQVFHIAGEHSKATDLVGGAGTIAKGAPLP